MGIFQLLDDVRIDIQVSGGIVQADQGVIEQGIGHHVSFLGG
jgi:hypothetical protein